MLLGAHHLQRHAESWSDKELHSPCRAVSRIRPATRTQQNFQMPRLVARTELLPCPQELGDLVGASGGAAVATSCRLFRKHGQGSSRHGERVDLVCALRGTLEERGSCGLLHAAPALQQEYAGCCHTCTSQRCPHGCTDRCPSNCADRRPRRCASSGCRWPVSPCKSGQLARPKQRACSYLAMAARHCAVACMCCKASRRSCNKVAKALSSTSKQHHSLNAVIWCLKTLGGKVTVQAAATHQTGIGPHIMELK